MMPTMYRLAWASLLVMGLAALLAMWLVALVPGGPAVSIAVLITPIPFVIVGSVVFALRPESLVVQRLMAVCAVVPIATAALVLSERAEGDAVLQFPAALVLEGATVGFTVAFVALLAVFPNGRYERTFERVLVRVAVASLLLVPLSALVGDTLPGRHSGTGTTPIHSPWAISVLAPLAPLVTTAIAGVNILLVAAIATTVLRYRRSGPEERRRMRWPLLAVVLAIAMWLIDAMVTSGGAANRELLDLGWTVVLFAIPIAFAIALFRYRVFDVDNAIRRTLIYGGIWALIATLYIAVAGAAGIAAGSRLPIEIAVLLTIGVTLVFQPVRSRLEAIADRWVFGERMSGYELLIRLGNSLRETVGVEELLPRLATTIRTGLAVRWVRVRLFLPGEMGAEPVVVDGEPTALAAATIPIIHGGVELGAIECGPRTADGRPLTQDDLSLVEGVARQGALAIRNAHLAAELQARVEQIRQQARQLSESRMRLVQAQVAERRRIERDIHDGAQQGIVSLIARARLARAQLNARGDAETTLVALQTDAERVLGELRELVGGIHPAVLSDRGLVDAIEERAGRLPVPVTVAADGPVRMSRYPDEIESAAFFLVLESMTNALKHGSPRRLEVRLSESDGWLSVEVCDDGTGFDAAAAIGSGLRGVADRIEAVRGRFWLDTAVGRGTAVRALLPAAEPSRA